MQTEYSKAWTAYKKSIDYKQSVAELKFNGLKQPYIDNMLKSAFEFAWNKANKS